jgi:hypothetical protein
VAISCLSLEELIYLNEKKEKDKKDEVEDEGSSKDNLINRRKKNK